MLVDVYIEVLNLSFVRLDGIDEHGLEDVAWSAPGSTSLNHDRAFTILQGVLPIAIRLHFPNVARLALEIGTWISVCP